eukprot:gene1714-483_t
MEKLQTNCAHAKPRGRFGHKILPIKNKIYVFGGYIKDSEEDSIQIFDVKTSTWEKSISLEFLQKVTGFSCNYHEEKNEVIIFNGKTLYVFSLCEEKIIQEMETNLQMNFHASIIYNEELLVCGGINANFYSFPLMYEDGKLKNSNWTLKEFLLDKKNFQFGDNGIFIRNNNDDLYFISRMDPNFYFLDYKKSLIKIVFSAEFLSTRYHTMNLIGNLVYFIGGFKYDSKIYVYNLESKKLDDFDGGDWSSRYLEMHSSCIVRYHQDVYIYSYAGWNGSMVIYDDMSRLDVTKDSFSSYTKDFLFNSLKNGSFVDLDIKY